MSIESYSDGSGQGPTGLGAASFIIVKDNSIIYQETRLLHNATNNVAEYTAIHMAVTWVASSGYKECICHTDSELIYKQIRGEYECNCGNLREWLTKVRTLSNGVIFKWVPRNHPYIKVADALNRATVKQAMR